MIALSNEHGFPDYMGLGTFQRVNALMELGEMDLHEGIAVMRALIDAARAMGVVVELQTMLPPMAERRNGPRDLGRGLSEIFVPEKTFITPPLAG